MFNEPSKEELEVRATIVLQALTHFKQRNSENGIEIEYCENAVEEIVTTHYALINALWRDMLEDRAEKTKIGATLEFSTLFVKPIIAKENQNPTELNCSLAMYLAVVFIFGMNEGGVGVEGIDFVNQSFQRNFSVSMNDHWMMLCSIFDEFDKNDFKTHFPLRSNAVTWKLAELIYLIKDKVQVEY